MKIGVFRNDRYPITKAAFDAALKGLGSLKLDFFEADQSKYISCDIAIVWGILKKSGGKQRRVGLKEIFEIQKYLNKKVIVIERGFIRRNKYYSIGYDGLNGRADFKNSNMPSDRIDLLKTKVLPWTYTGENILLCGQVPWDSSVQHLNPKGKDFSGYVNWCKDAIVRIRENTDRQIVFRSHPALLSADNRHSGILDWIKSEKDIIWSEAPIKKDLKDAWAVVAYNSNATVEAALCGVPVFVDDIGAMSLSIANTDFSMLDNPLRPDRTQWLNNIAYSQWSLKEMRKGLPFSHLLGLR